MGGTNPYIEPVRADLPKQPYTITFVLGDGGETRLGPQPPVQGMEEQDRQERGEGYLPAQVSLAQVSHLVQQHQAQLLPPLVSAEGSRQDNPTPQPEAPPPSGP